MDFTEHIHITKLLIEGAWLEQALDIPIENRGAVARGTAILNAYTNFALKDYNEIQYKYAVPNPDDGYAILNAYIYGAIQLAEDFGTEDFYNYYDMWVDKVIIPAIIECNYECVKKNFDIN